MDRSNHYEAAFEGYLQWHRYCYVAVDESRRSYLGEKRIKSLDFIVHGEGGARLLVDVKGRRFPAGKSERPRTAWECWSAREDIDSLLLWAERFGPGYQPVLVFVYQVMDYARAVPPGEDLWTWHDRKYLLRAIAVSDYRYAMRVRSPRWGTVALPNAEYRRLWRPFGEFVRAAAPTDGVPF